MESNDFKLNQIIEEKNKVNELTKNGNFIQAEKGYLDMCRYCNGARAKNFPIPAAEQM